MKKHGPLKDLSWLLFLIFFLIPILTLSPGAAAAASTKRYLPLVLKEPSTPAPGTRLVVFEGFYNPT
jgi:hypothetical protein